MFGTVFNTISVHTLPLLSHINGFYRDYVSFKCYRSTGCPSSVNCSIPCPKNCQEGYCAIGGACLGCLPGYIGHTCSEGKKKQNTRVFVITTPFSLSFFFFPKL